MTPELPPHIKSEYKTKEKVHSLLNRYKHREFGVSLNDYCIIPSIYKDTMIVVFLMQEVKPSIFNHHETMFIYHNTVLPTKVIFLCDFDYLDGDASVPVLGWRPAQHCGSMDGVVFWARHRLVGRS
jgi:hypothetical protein